MTHSMEDLAGTVLAEHYPLEEFLGRDERGAFFRTRFQQQPAIIQLMPAVAKAFWSRAAQIDHPHVQRILDTGVADDWCFAVYEAPDECLAAALDSLSPEQSREVVDTVRDALTYLHAQGFAHGAVHADHIVAVGNTIRLESGTLRDASPPAEADDWREFDRLAAALGVVEKQPVGGRYRPWLIVGAAVLTVAGIVALTRKPAAPPPPIHPVTYVAPPPRAAAPAAAPTTAPPAHVQPTGNWRVIAYTYTKYRDAEHKAETINRKHPALHAEVFAPNGTNHGPYLVALGGRTTRAEAERLAHRAKSEGLPRDTFARNYTR